MSSAMPPRSSKCSTIDTDDRTTDDRSTGSSCLPLGRAYCTRSRENRRIRCALAPIRRSFSTSAALLALRLELAHQVLGVDRDRRQRVVELVDDAGRELAERREPLGAYDLLLQDIDLRLILTDRDDGLDRPAGAADRRDRPHAAHGRPCVVGSITVTAAWCWPRSAVGERDRELLALIGGDEVADVAAEQVVARAPGEIEQRAVADRDPPLAIDAEDQRVRGVEQARLVVAQADRVVLQRDRAQRDRQAVRERAQHRLVVLAQRRRPGDSRGRARRRARHLRRARSRSRSRCR